MGKSLLAKIKLPTRGHWGLQHAELDAIDAMMTQVENARMPQNYYAASLKDLTIEASYAEPVTELPASRKVLIGYYAIIKKERAMPSVLTDLPETEQGLISYVRHAMSELKSAEQRSKKLLERIDVCHKELILRGYFWDDVRREFKNTKKERV